MDSKIHKLPNAQIGQNEPQKELISHLEEALALAKGGEAVGGGVGLVLKRSDGIYYWNSHHIAPGLSAELYFGISRLKARLATSLEFFDAPSP